MEVMNKNMEKNFFTYILENPAQFGKVEAYFFKDDHIQLVYSIVREEYLISKKVPSLQQIVDMVKLNDPEGKIPNEIIKIILKNDITDKKDWLEMRFRSWKISNLVRNNTSQTITELRNLQDLDLENVKSVTEKIRNLYNNIPLMDEDEDDLGDDFDNPESHRQDIAKYTIPTGWSSMDKILGGGWDLATFTVFMGETNCGKCAHYQSIIKIKNKKTGIIESMSIGDFYKLKKI